MTIGVKIKELCKKNDLTQEKLADYLHVSYQAVSKWETGISGPDLSLIASLTKLLHILADELFGLNDTESDVRRKKLEEAYKNTWNTGDLEERYKITEAEVQEYPGEKKYLDRFAWTEAIRSFEFKDDEIYRAEQEKAIKHFAMIIEDCTDDKIKRSAIRGITQYLSFRGRKDEAKRYAELYPENESVSKNDLLGFYLTGDELVCHKQKMLKNSLWDLLLKLYDSRSLTAYNAAEGLFLMIFPDENYLDYHSLLYMMKLGQAQINMTEDKPDEAIKALWRACYHAIVYDKIDRSNPGIYKYTATLFDHLEFDTNTFIHTGTETMEETLYENINSQWASPLRDREDFLKLSKKDIIL